jgi:hypothetical protein
MAYGAKTVGPGGSSKAAGCAPGKSIGPGGAGGSGSDMTTRRGYEPKRTTGLRDEYKQSGRAENGKASK